MPRTSWDQCWRDYHVLEDRCINQTWCRLHWWPGFDGMGAPTKLQYPFDVRRYSSREGWQDVMVHCGPGAYLPKKTP